MSYNNGTPPDPIESAAKGAVKAGIEWTAEKINEYVDNFKNRKLAFVEDSLIIEKIKKQREKGEWQLFKSFIKDSKLHILFQTGLTLRELEQERKDTKPLIEKIYKKYDKKGVHIAWFAENGLFGKYVSYLLDAGLSSKDIEKEIKELFDDIDNRVMFIGKKHGVKIKQKVGEIVAKILTFNPKLYIISSIGGAIINCEKTMKGVMNKIGSSYNCESFYKKGKRIYFLIRKDEII